jgi:hypothetical protein
MSALIFAMSASSGEVLDRIAVTVDDVVITESEISRQLRITAFLNEQAPDFSISSKRDMADKLVEQALIRREIRTNRYTLEAPGSAPARYTQLRKRYPDDTLYRTRLAEYRITDQDVLSALEWQDLLIEFIGVRFRPGVQIPESEIRDYYERNVRPEAGKSGEGKSPKFDEARASIEEILTQQRVDNALDRWLGQARTQSRIKYRPEAFR